MIVSDKSRNPFRAFRGFGDDTTSAITSAAVGLSTIARDIATVVTGGVPATGQAAPLPRPAPTSNNTMLLVGGGVAAVAAVLLLTKRKR